MATCSVYVKYRELDLRSSSIKSHRLGESLMGIRVTDSSIDSRFPQPGGLAVAPPTSLTSSRSSLRRWKTVALLLLSDLLALTFSFLIAATLVDLLLGPIQVLAYVAYSPALVALPAGFLFLGLYPAAGVGPVEEMRRQLVCITTFVAVLAAFLVVAPQAPVVSIVVLVLFWLLALVLVPAGRAVVRLIFSSRGWWGEPVVVLGAGKTAELLITRLKSMPGLDLKVVGCLDDDGSKTGRLVAGVPVSGTLESAYEFKDRYGVDYAIVAMPGADSDRITELVQNLSTAFRSVVVIPNTFGMTSVGTSTRDSGGLVGIHVYGHLSRPRDRMLKRLVDLLMLVPVGILALPLIVLSALAVVVVSPGMPFYRQQREGYRGRPIYIWKLRTMRRDSDAALKELLATDVKAKTEWEQHFKLTHDPRVLPVIGKFLRRTSIDELPQLLNVLKGEMSFVGPRPFPYYHLDQFGPHFRRLRTSVPPGITGYWQVTSRSTADLMAQVELDSYYIKNWSPWMDLYILGRTPWAVLFGPGAY